MTNEDRATFLQSVKAAFRSNVVVPAGCGIRSLTQTHVAIAHLLAGWRSSPTPSHKQLAFAARCSVRTVRHALSAFRALGLLHWTRRVASICGWRAQMANSYRAGAGAKEPRSTVLDVRPATVAASGVLEACRAIVGRYSRPESVPPEAWDAAANRDRQLRALGFGHLVGRRAGAGA
jgi:hypothetical protein